MMLGSSEEEGREGSTRRCLTGDHPNTSALGKTGSETAQAGYLLALLNSTFFTSELYCSIRVDV